MTHVVRPQSVIDTSADPAHRPFRVEVEVSEPVIGIDRHAAHLDGPLSWCAYQQVRAMDARKPPMTHDWVCDLALPLATWTRPGRPSHEMAASGDPDRPAWGWCVSRAQWEAVAHTAIHTRRMPNTEAHARFTAARRFNAGLGPTKARNTLTGAVWPTTITWHGLGDPDAVRDLLTVYLTHLGQIVRHGHGAILSIAVTEDNDRDAWTDRLWPADGYPARAPYWHGSRRVTC